MVHQKNEKWQSCFIKGLKLYATGNSPDASDEFEKALKLNPKNSDCHLWLAKCMADLGSYDMALVEFNKAISLSPQNHLAHFEKGDALALIERFDEALIEMDNAIEIDPENVNYHYYKALVLLALKNYETALVEVDNALKIRDESHLHFAKAEILIQLKRIKEAEEEQLLVKDMQRIMWKKHPSRYISYFETMRWFALAMQNH